MDDEEENSSGLESMRIRLAVMKVREQEDTLENSCTKDRFIIQRLERKLTYLKYFFLQHLKIGML